MDADEAEVSREKTYHTCIGSRGYWVALRPAIVGVLFAMVLVGMGMRPMVGDMMRGDLSAGLLLLAVVLMIPVLLVYARVLDVREHDLTTVLSDAGVTVKNGCGRKRLTPWQDIAGMVWSGPPKYALWLEVLGRRGKRRRRIIANEYPATSAVVGELREAILSRLGLEVVSELDKGFRGNDQRIWR